MEKKTFIWKNTTCSREPQIEKCLKDMVSRSIYAITAIGTRNREFILTKNGERNSRKWPRKFSRGHTAGRNSGRYLGKVGYRRKNMMNFKCQRRSAWITEEDVRNLRDEIHEGDCVLIGVENEEFIGGRIRIRTQLKKAVVKAKYRNLVEIEAKGPKRQTVTYKEILVNELRRAQG